MISASLNRDLGELNHDLGEFNQAFVLMLLGALLLLPPLFMAIYHAAKVVSHCCAQDGATKRSTRSPYLKVSHRHAI